MKLLILLLLIPLFACSHEPPLIDHDHQHEHDLPDHDHPYLFPRGLPFAYILSVDPPLTGRGA